MIDAEKLREISIRLGAVKNDIDASLEGMEESEEEEDADEEDPFDMQEPNQPASAKSEYTTGEAQTKARGKNDPKKVGLMIALLKGKKK